MAEFSLENWLPMPLQMGPPLPRSMDVTWPWYKPPEVPPEVIPPEEVPMPPVGYYSLFIYIVGKGIVTPGSGNYPSGSVVTLTAVPSPGYAFDRWSGDLVGTRPMVNITTNRNKSVTAYFKAIVEVAPPEAPPEIPEAPPAPPPEIPGVADIRVQTLTIQPSQVDVGDRVAISVVAFNYGTASGSKEIRCDVNGKVSSQTVALDPNQSKTISFEATPKEAKTYSVLVNGLRGSFKAVEVVPISNISYQNPPSREGEEIRMVLTASLPKGAVAPEPNYVYRAWFVSPALKAPEMLRYPPGVGYLSIAYSASYLKAEISGANCVSPIPNPDDPISGLPYPPRSITGKFQIEVYSALADYSALKELVYKTELAATLHS